MKNTGLFIGAISFLLGAHAWAGGVSSGTNPHRMDPDPVAATVSGVMFQRIHGCGTHPCPTESQIKFQVPFGGACHSYSFQSKNSHGKLVITLLDQQHFGCAAPEQINYEVTLGVPNDLVPDGSSFLIANPQFVQEIMPP